MHLALGLRQGLGGKRIEQPVQIVQILINVVLPHAESAAAFSLIFSFHVSTSVMAVSSRGFALILDDSTG